MTIPKTSPRLIETATRRAFVMNLRLSGAKFEDIAAACVRQFGKDNLPAGYDQRQACQDVLRELRKINAERDEAKAELLRLELERLDRMLLAIWQAILNGHLGAIDRGLKIGERRAVMLGLNQPTQIAPVTPSGEPLFNAAELIELLNRADEMVAKGLGSESPLPG